MLNNVSLMGRLTRDPELRHTQNDTPVLSFSLAVNRPKPKDGDAATDFIDVVAWRQTAEFVSKYFSKGQLCAIEGRIQTRTYEDKEGNKRKAVEVLANRVHFAGRQRDAAPNVRYGGDEGLPGDFVPDFGDPMEGDGALPF